jgi:predicted AAA+ superfamily ATPase
MIELYSRFLRKLSHVTLDFTRSAMDEIPWKAQLVGIKGARGVGKTTLLLQYIKLHLSDQIAHTLYVSLDSFWFSSHSLSELIEEFYQQGGKFLFLDEVHKYPNWAQELKNAYDDFPDLKVVFTGSSALEIINARADLSRRAVIYEMQGFSFREFLSIETKIDFSILSLKEILEKHVTIAQEIAQKVKPFQYFSNYLDHGYYPFYREDKELYEIKLTEVVNMILEIELPLLRGIEPGYVFKLKELLSVISASVPFTPNISKLGEKLTMNRTTILLYLHYFEEVRLTNNLFKEANGISKLQKPQKIYLENTNLMQLLSPNKVNIGNARETFFANQVGYRHKILYTENGDFLVDEKYTFEIGGKSKSKRQIEGIEHAFIAADEIEYGLNQKIPLWLFGFLY